MSPTATTDALSRSVALLAEAPARTTTPNGYLDLLADERPPARGWLRLAKGPLGPGMRDEHRIARLLLGLRPGDGVLDVGCGTGAFTREFARLTGREGLAVGLDASAAALTRAARETPQREVAYVRADARALPFRDASFDAVACFAVLDLVPEPLAVLDETARVLTPGGRIALFASCAVRSLPLRAVLRVPFGREDLPRALAERGFEAVHQRVHGLTQFVGGRLAGA